MTATASTAPAATDVTASQPRHFASSDLIPVAFWSKDHYSTLAYVETVMVECAGFEIGVDPRMRSNRRNFRVLMDNNKSPRRPGNNSWQIARVMESKHTSFLKDGAVSEDHDDWACLQDMAVSGLFSDNDGRSLRDDCIEPGCVIHLSPLGRRFVVELREHKAAGGNFADFLPSAELREAAQENFG